MLLLPVPAHPAPVTGPVLLAPGLAGLEDKVFGPEIMVPAGFASEELSVFSTFLPQVAHPRAAVWHIMVLPALGPHVFSRRQAGLLAMVWIKGPNLTGELHGDKVKSFT